MKLARLIEHSMLLPMPPTYKIWTVGQISVSMPRDPGPRYWTRAARWPKCSNSLRWLGSSTSHLYAKRLNRFFTRGQMCPPCSDSVTIYLFCGLFEVTRTTQAFLFIGRSDANNVFIGNDPMRKNAKSSIAALGTQTFQEDNVISQSTALEKFWIATVGIDKGFSLISTIQADENEFLSQCIDHLAGKVYQARTKLCFFDNNVLDLVCGYTLETMHQGFFHWPRDAGHTNFIVGRDHILGFRVLPTRNVRFDDETSKAHALISLHMTDDVRGLACKHRSHHDAKHFIRCAHVWIPKINFQKLSWGFLKIAPRNPNHKVCAFINSES